jgi:hypothetical protein
MWLSEPPERIYYGPFQSRPNTLKSSQASADLCFKLTKGTSIFLISQSLTLPSIDALINTFSKIELNLTSLIYLVCPAYLFFITGLYCPLALVSYNLMMESSHPQRIKLSNPVSIQVGSLWSVIIDYFTKYDFSTSTNLIA